VFIFGLSSALVVVLNSEKDAQMCIYDASWDTQFGFCCDIDEETSRELSGKFIVIFTCFDSILVCTRPNHLIELQFCIILVL
jgi:hypothetical protein